MSIWYPRHMLQFRIGLFYGAATVAGTFFQKRILCQGQLTFTDRCILWRACLWYLVHVGNSWLAGLVLDICAWLRSISLAHHDVAQQSVGSQILEGIATVVVGFIAFFGGFIQKTNNHYYHSDTLAADSR